MNIFSKIHEYTVLTENIKCKMSQQLVAVHFGFGCFFHVSGVGCQDFGTPDRIPTMGSTDLILRDQLDSFMQSLRGQFEEFSLYQF